MDSAVDPQKVPVYGFIHVAMHGHWKSVLNEQFHKMNDSGLHERTERIFIVLLGPDRGQFQFQSPKFEIVHTSTNFTEYEFPTLTRLHNFAKNHDGLLYYIHTKGVFHDTPFTRDWRHYMEYFAIEKWRPCEEALQTHDACGVNWSEKPWRHFSGNFWWARADYIRKLQPPAELQPMPAKGVNRRHDSERWIGTGRPRVKCFHDSGVNHYYHFYKRAAYAREDGRSGAAELQSGG